jgi:hypothetical protein
MSDHSINELDDIELKLISAGRIAPAININISPVIYGPRINMNIGILVIAGNRGATTASLKQIIFS